MHERISTGSQVCHGQACVKGTRIPARQIALMLANGDTVEDLLEEYPAVTREDISTCINYAGSLAGGGAQGLTGAVHDF